MQVDTQVLVIGELPGAGTPDEAVTIDEAAGKAESSLPKQATLNADGSVTLVLLYPESLAWKRPGGETHEDRHERLTFKRLKGADVVAMKAAPADKADQVIMARSLGMMPILFDKLYAILDAADISNMNAVITYFLESGRKAGQ